MTNPQLTVKQFAILTLGQSTPPWHLGDLLKSYNQYRISLRESLTALSGATTVIFTAIDDFAQRLNKWIDLGIEGQGAGATYRPNPAIWPGFFSDFDTTDIYGNLAGTPAALVELMNILSPIGGSIVYTNEYYTTVGIAASFGALARLNTAEVPDTPPSSFLTFTEASLRTDAVDGAVLLGPIAGQNGGTVVLSSTPYTPLPPAMAGSVPMGLLWIYLDNQQNRAPAVKAIDLRQLAAQHMEISRDTIISLIRDTTAGLASEGVSGALASAVADLTEYVAWLNQLATMTPDDPLAAGTSLSLGFNGSFTIPQITLQLAGTSQPPITISEFTVQPDGSSTGGTVSQ